MPSIACWSDRAPSWARRHGQDWWRIGPSLAVDWWQPAAFDLPGHGYEPRLSVPLTLDILVSSVRIGLTAVDLLIGHSLGAIAALALAGRTNRVAHALVLEEPPGFASVDTGRIAASFEADAALARSDPADYEKRIPAGL